MNVPFSIIVAMDEKSGIGKGGTLPWKLSADLKHFKKVTTAGRDTGKTNVVIMGRKTWDSLPDAYRPLPERVNVVVTRNNQLLLPDGVHRASGLGDALDFAKKSFGATTHQVFVIGGAEIFAEAVQNPDCHKLYLTKIQGDFACDVTFPLNLQNYELVSDSPQAREGDLQFSFHEYTRKLA